MTDIKELKVKHKKIELLLEKLDERLALGDISEAQYKHLSDKYKAENDNIKNHIIEKELLIDTGLESDMKETQKPPVEGKPETDHVSPNYITPSVIDHLPSVVRNNVVNFSAEKQEEFLEEYRRKSKSKFIAYLLWLFFGLHYIYMKRWGTQIIFWLTAGGFLIWWIIDIFRVGGLIDNYNKDIAVDALRNIKAVSD